MIYKKFHLLLIAKFIPKIENIRKYIIISYLLPIEFVLIRSLMHVANMIEN